ncbi:hypothetical protein [Thermomicrobium sp.]
MAFTVEDFQDLVRLLAQHPEWRSELRRLLLSEELLTVPERLARAEQLLAESVRRDEERSRQVAELIEAVRENTRQIAELRETVAEQTRQIAELRVVVQEHTRQIAELRETVAEHSRQIERLSETVQILSQRLDKVAERADMALGELLELRAERRLSSWLGRLLRGIRVRPPGEWERELRPLLSPDAFARLLDADLLARGRLALDGQREIWLVVEVSRVVDAQDVSRAWGWARLLRQAGLVAVPVVLGGVLTGEAEESVARERVLFVEATLQRVQVHGWEAARERWVA